jgi:hypothetical protein
MIQVARIGHKQGFLLSQVYFWGFRVFGRPLHANGFVKTRCWLVRKTFASKTISCVPDRSLTQASPNLNQTPQ